MNRSVSVTLRGGLGNQLFCWAAAFSLSTRLERELVLLGGKIRRTDYHILDPRSFDLDYFGFREASRARSVWDLRIERKPIFRESGFDYDSRFEDIPGPVRLDGYFQSWRYFEAVQPAVRNLLTSRMELSLDPGDMRRRVKGERWIGVHVRRGDYEKVGIMALPGQDYYSAAVEKVQQLTGVTHVVVFSDDVVAARKVVPFADQYLGPAEVRNAGDVLNLLSQADGLVGANSSLSWWAGFLNREPESPKIFPKEWFTDSSVPTGDLLFPTWERI